MTDFAVWPGKPFPLGANWDGEGTNFSLFSENAAKVELLLFSDAGSSEPEAVLPLPERLAYVWHGYVPQVRPGRAYAYRVYGPYEPEAGHRFNPAKVLLDPYAKAVAGHLEWNDALFGYRVGDPGEDLSRDDRDSAPFAPKGVVIDPAFDWEGDRLLCTPWNETVIYEVHVKGLTARHPEVEEALRGTYAGLASPPVIAHLRDLGVTAVELLPVHHHMDERSLLEKGLVNYWGYNTLGFFAPDSRYARGNAQEQVREFKSMVKALHRAGIEVILDVVYNHTAEGNQLGPTLCFRGIDNASYYHLSPGAPRYYMDFSGTGNALNMSHPYVTQMIMDSLRYWVTEMHVDGFRFDLASALAREMHEVDRLATFFDIIHQDPCISQVKLIAEPWDLGEGGYQVGNFPPLWAEWNGRYRDTVREFWRKGEHSLAELGYRLAGSSDLYQDDGRRPYASINFITAHDGFTLEDLVSYDEKHNEANGEDNRDGADDNRSWNCGEEGPTDDPQIQALRRRQKRNFLATLFLSQGVPMLGGGDEIGRTQRGNNNAYCQDNELSWHDWELDEEERRLLAFTRTLIRMRRDHPVLRRRRFFQGRKLHGSDVKDILWLRPDGKEMADEDWQERSVGQLGVLLNGVAMGDRTAKGERIVDDVFLVLFNAAPEPQTFRFPEAEHRWEVLVVTWEAEAEPGQVVEAEFSMEGRSLAFLRSLDEWQDS